MSFIARLWRWFSWRHWAWAMGASVALCVSIPVQNLTGNHGWALWRIYYQLPWFMAIGCVFLVAIAVIEVRTAPRVPGLLGYLGAAIVATALSIAATGSLHDFIKRSPTRVVQGRVQPPIPPHLRAAASRSNAMIGLPFDTTTYGVIATMIYGLLRRSRNAEEVLAQVELARSASRQRLVASRLEAGRAAVDPLDVLARLERIQAVYEEHAAHGDALMDDLIAELRGAIPRLHASGHEPIHEPDCAPG